MPLSARRKSLSAVGADENTTAMAGDRTPTSGLTVQDANHWTTLRPIYVFTTLRTFHGQSFSALPHQSRFTKKFLDTRTQYWCANFGTIVGSICLYLFMHYNVFNFWVSRSEFGQIAWTTPPQIIRAHTPIILAAILFPLEE